MHACTCTLPFRMCLAVVLSSLLQRELDDFVSYWNSHGYNRMAECPSGRPEDLFEMAEEFGI